MSISPFFGLDMALRALQAQQTGIDVTSHNVANANTDGFSRQNVTIVATEPFAPPGMNRPATAGQIGTGSVAADIQRARDMFLDSQWRAEAGSAANASNRSDALEQVEVVLDEPQGVGLASLFNEYYRVWNELSNDPSASALPVRTTVVQQTLSLTTAMNRISGQLANVRVGQNSEIITDVAEVNDLTGQILDLNGTIIQIELTGQAANDLRDRRDSLMDRLSQLVQVSSNENADGSINVMMGSQVLVNGGIGKTDLFTVPNAGNNGFVDVTFGSGGPAATMGNAGITGRLTARDTLVPKYQAQLDTIAANLISAVNTLHTSGFDVNGNAGQPFFTGTNAATISVNTAIQADPSLIAASNTAGASGNNEIALAIIAAAHLDEPAARGPARRPPRPPTTRWWPAWARTTGRPATRSNTQEALVDLLARRRQSLSGVSLDEEATNLLRYQRAYEAAARVLSTYDEILDKLINGTGTVGR